MSTRREIKFFTVADFIEEEEWLRRMHNSGWRLVTFTLPCFFVFESCEPEDVIYRLDFKNNSENADYMQMLADYGWEYIGHCVGWLYFRKSAAQLTNESEGELFSDNESRIDMLERIMKTRILPLLIIFICCVLPNARRAADSSLGAVFTVFWGVMIAIYAYLFVHCGTKLRRMKQELE